MLATFLALGLALTFVPAIAIAGTEPSAQVIAPTSTSKSASSKESICSMTVRGKVGHYICNTDRTYLPYGPGHGVYGRWFVIGANHAIWNIAVYHNGTASDWKSLGGWGQYGVYADDWDPENPSYVRIMTFGYGSPAYAWCRGLNHQWGKWYRSHPSVLCG